MDRRTIPRSAQGTPTGRVKRNRRRKDRGRATRRWAMTAVTIELLILLLCNPTFWIRHVRIEGLQTLNANQVFIDARIRPRTNLLMLLFREPVVSRLERDPVIDHAVRLAQFPDTLILRIRERQPYAVLLIDDRYWLLSPEGIPYRLLTGPVHGLPLLKFVGPQNTVPITLGAPIKEAWVVQSFKLLTLIGDHQDLEPELVTVDQNGNLCLNRADKLQIILGQPDDLQEKLAVAAETLGPVGENGARNIAYIDVSSPGHPAYMPRRGDDSKANDNRNDRDDGSGNH